MVISGNMYGGLQLEIWTKKKKTAVWSNIINAMHLLLIGIYLILVMVDIAISVKQ